jgi:poly-gamma-glutamate capsule biosynthesis protein CapA/YwtB (metallophosphatase superfamily)
LRKEPENISKLKLLALLKEGQSILATDIIQDNYCPLCQQKKNKIELLKELNLRIQELEKLENIKYQLEDQVKTLESILRVNSNMLEGLLKEKLFRDKAQEELLKDILSVKTSLSVYYNEISKEITAQDSIQKPSEILINPNIYLT